MTKFKQVEHATVGGDDQGRRLDNWLLSRHKNIPRSRIYSAIRHGEVRVDGRRAKASDKVAAGDRIRIPPLRQHHVSPRPSLSLNRQTREQLEECVLYEDEHVLVLDKPAGWAVHAGHRRQFGLSEALLRLRADDKERLTPAHRLDRETSGCLVFARNKPDLLSLHKAFRQRKVEKFYLALLVGQWHDDLARVECPLSVARQGKTRKAFVDNSGAGKPALSLFKPLRQFSDCALVQVETKSGRTHQIRAHAAYRRHPLVGDDRYGQAEQHAACSQLRAPRLCLHASRIAFTLHERNYCFVAPLPRDFAEVLEKACYN